MQFEQYPLQDFWTPSSDEDGVQQLSSSLTSLDFYLLDNIDAYLSSVQPKTSKNDLINDSLNDNSVHQEDFFLDFDFGDINDFEETSDLLADSILTEDVDIEKWISQSSFPSPPTDTCVSSPLNAEDASSILTSIADSFITSADMIVPPSPSLSSTNSSPAPAKKTKLSVNERKLRKKDQNKTAAEKYRLKKKSERHQLLDRQLKLKNQNTELKSELENLTYRVQQFKKLFSELVQIESPISN